MANSSAAINNVKDLCPPSRNWSIKVRVIRMWTSPSFDGTDTPSSLELIFLDQQGGKIQASLRKGMYQRWSGKFMEGIVYKITTCHLIPNLGSYRATEHPYRMIFTGKTKVVPSECSSIPMWGLTLKTSEQVHAPDVQTDYLVDMVGLVSAASTERSYMKEGKEMKILTLELTDDKGKVELTVFGEYVAVINDYLSSHSDGKPVVVVELAKIKTFKGKNGLQNVMNASRLNFNPDIPEVRSFKDVIGCNGVEIDDPVGKIVTGYGTVSLNEDFIKMHPRKVISALNETKEDGFFIILAEVVGLLQDDTWWYNACKCHKGVTIEDGRYYCPACMKHVTDVVPRYKVKLEVCDGSDSANFMMFDSDAQHLLNKSCKDMLATVEDPKSPDCTPEMEQLLIGKKVLWKVEKKSDNLYHYDDSYRVKRVCDDAAIIELFKSDESVQTPITAKFTAPFTIATLDEVEENKVAATDVDVCLSPALLTPNLGSDPSMVGTSAKVFKKLDEELDMEVYLPKKKLKRVKIEKM